MYMSGKKKTSCDKALRAKIISIEILQEREKSSGGEASDAYLLPSYFSAWMAKRKMAKKDSALPGGTIASFASAHER